MKEVGLPEGVNITYSQLHQSQSLTQSTYRHSLVWSNENANLEGGGCHSHHPFDLLLTQQPDWLASSFFLIARMVDWFFLSLLRTRSADNGNFCKCLWITHSTSQNWGGKWQPFSAPYGLNDRSWVKHMLCMQISGLIPNTFSKGSQGECAGKGITWDPEELLSVSIDMVMF